MIPKKYVKKLLGEWKRGAEKLFQWKEHFRWPTLAQWKKTYIVFSRQEKILLGILFLINFVALATIISLVWISQTIPAPATGGTYTEGLIGQPRFLNPALAAANDVDRDISELVFSGLMKYDGNGNLIPDLAESYEQSDDGKQYTFVLKKGIRWHNRAPLNADDIVFTIRLIQNSDYKSPLRINWLGVDVEKLNDYTIRFTLKNPYPMFLENATQKIMSSSLWNDVPSYAFPLHEQNLKPVGTGPFEIERVNKDEHGKVFSITLRRYKEYEGQKPFLDKIVFYFFKSERDAFEALKRGEIDGVQYLSPAFLQQLPPQIKAHSISIPRYFAVFFNQIHSDILKDKRIRAALLAATNKEEILAHVFQGKGLSIDSPFVPGFFVPHKEISSAYNIEKAGELLDQAGWKRKPFEKLTGDDPNRHVRVKVQERIKFEGRRRIREKVEVPLEITLTTVTSPELIQIAEILQSQWEQVGFKVHLAIIAPKELQEEWIRPRTYEALLFGQVLGRDPDPFVFWHSSQIQDPGLNLAQYSNKETDALMEQARQIQNEDLRREKYILFEKKLLQDLPALFLVSPSYMYPLSAGIQGFTTSFIVDPSKRFSSIEQWYIKSKRILKIKN